MKIWTLDTYIGGEARNMHRGKKNRVIKGTGGMGKVAVMGLLKRNSPDKPSCRLNLPNLGSIPLADVAFCAEWRHMSLHLATFR